MAPSLLLLPGLACDAELFADQMPALRAAGCAAHVGDVHARCPTLPDMAATLLAECPGTHVLVGCSMGAMLGFELLRQAPERVRGFAILGSSARPDTPELVALRSAACAQFEQGRLDEVLLPNVPLAFHPDNAADPALVQRYLAMVQRAGAAQLIAQNRAVMARPDSRPLLPHVACPVLVIAGVADQLTPPGQAEEIAAAVPDAELHVLDAAGHMLTWEQPAQVNALLLDWLARRFRRPAGAPAT
jgi:pimeloyl-ACP methyl ester carboxylesterase